MWTASVANPLGLSASPRLPLVVARNGAKVRGQVVMADLGWSAVETDSIEEGKRTSALTNVVLPDADARKGKGILLVLRDDIADDALGQAYVRGLCDALIYSGTGTIAKGAPLVATTSGYLTSDMETGDKIVAHNRQAVTGATSPTLYPVAFKGESGFGVQT